MGDGEEEMKRAGEWREEQSDGVKGEGERGLLHNLLRLYSTYHPQASTKFTRQHTNVKSDLESKSSTKVVVVP